MKPLLQNYSIWFLVKILPLIELLNLTFIILYAWQRLDGRLSSPFHQELSISSVLLNIGISVAILLRMAVILGIIKTAKLTSTKAKLTILGLYVFMISPDVYIFTIWNVYAKMYFHINILLLSPILLAITSIALDNKNK